MGNFQVLWQIKQKDYRADRPSSSLKTALQLHKSHYCPCLYKITLVTKGVWKKQLEVRGQFGGG